MRTQRHHPWQLTWLATAISMAMAATLATRAEDTAVKLPAAALAVINATYPGCTIRDVEAERERKIRFFEVSIALPGRAIEAEITSDGHIIETEEKVAVDAVPAALKAEITKLTASGQQVTTIEKHEILSVPSLGAFRQLAKPVLFYDLKTRAANGTKRSLLFEQDASGLIPKGRAADDDDDDDDDGDDDDDDDD